MKYTLLLLVFLFVTGCSREEAFQNDNLKPKGTNAKLMPLKKITPDISSISGRAVCGSVTSIKLIQKKEADGTTTVTTDYSVKNCSNIVPVTIYLDITNRNTNQQVKLFSNQAFSAKIPWAGLNTGDYYQFTVFVIRNDTQEVIDAQAQFASIQ